MKRSLSALVVVVLLLAPGCGSSKRGFQPVIDPELANLSKEEVFARAERQMEEKEWVKARRHYSHVYENYPNDPLGRRSLLRVADTYFNQGGELNLVEAQYKYRDFINRYPGSELADYAMLQIAMVSYKQMESPDRDQSKTRETVTKLREMIQLYPNSEYRKEADERLGEALDRLAAHEHVVARYYMRREEPLAAVSRLNGLIDEYPNYKDRAGAFFDLAVALSELGRTGEARLYLERVIAEFPESEFARRARERLQDLAA